MYGELTLSIFMPRNSFGDICNRKKQLLYIFALVAKVPELQIQVILKFSSWRNQFER